MKISVPRHEPLSFASGETPVGRLCRQYSSMGGSVLESLESPKEKQRAWWSRLGSDVSRGPSPPEDRKQYNLTSIDAKGQDVHSNQVVCSQVSLSGADSEAHHHSSRVIHQPIQSHFWDRNESLQMQTEQLNSDMHSKISASHSHTDLFSLDEESHCHPAVLVSECHCEPQLLEGATEKHAMARVKLMCSFGGKIMARPIDAKLRYVGGETRIVAVCKNVSFAEFMSRMTQFYGSPLGFKYQLPDEDLDALVSVASDDDLQNMMEEYEKVGSSGCRTTRLRLFFFSAPSELEVGGMSFEGEETCPVPDRTYVEAINGMAAKLHVSRSENDFSGMRHVDSMSSTEGVHKASILEQTNENSQDSGASSSSSSPVASKQPLCHKAVGLTDISFPNAMENWSKITRVGFEADADQDASGACPSTPFHKHNDHQQYDHQFSIAVESPRRLHVDAPNSRYGENRIGMRRIDSQTKLTRLTDQSSDHRLGMGAPLEHRHDTQYHCDAVLSQGEQHHVNQQHVLASTQHPHHQQHPHQRHHHHHHHHYHKQQPQQQQQQQQQQHQQQRQQQQFYQHHHPQQQQQHLQYHYHQQHQNRYVHSDGDAGRSDHSDQEIHKPSQLHVLQHHHHHHHALHQKHYNASAHENYLNSDHVVPRSTQVSTQMLHGMAPAPPYQMDSAPSSPRIGPFEYQGKCACGLQHSQVHRGITVSIGEHPHNRWPLTTVEDQGVRKQTLRGSSRFQEGNHHGLESYTWQQFGYPLVLSEADQKDHKEYISHWIQGQGRHLGEIQPGECHTRDHTMQYHELLVHNGESLPLRDWVEQNNSCNGMNCMDNQRQPMESTMIHMAPSAAADQELERYLHHRGYDVDTARVSSVKRSSSRAHMHRDEEMNDVDERRCEGEPGMFGCHILVDPESRRVLVGGPHTENAHLCRKSQGPVTGRFTGPDEALAFHSSSQRAFDFSSKLASRRTSMEVVGACEMLPSDSSTLFDLISSQREGISDRMIDGNGFLLAKDLPAVNIISNSYALTEGQNFGHFISPEAEHQGSPIDKLQSFCRSNFVSSYEREQESTFGNQSANSLIEFVDQRRNDIPSSTRNAHLLNPDVIPMGPVASTYVATPEVGKVEQTVISPMLSLSDSDSTQLSKFSFAAVKLQLPVSKTSFEKEHASFSAALTDSITSSVLEYCSSESLNCAKSLDQQQTSVESQKNLKGGDQEFCSNTREGEDSAGGIDSKIIPRAANSMKQIRTESSRDSSIIHSNSGSLQECDINISAGNKSLASIVDIKAVQTFGGSTQNTQQDKASEEQGHSMGTAESKEPSISEAEAEAVARGLQIIKNSDLEDMKELGSGTYGTVYHGKWRGSDVAIKRFKPSCFTGSQSGRERLIADFWKEACTLGQLHHPNVVAFYGVVPDGPGGSFATVTEYMVNGSLKQVLSKKDRTIDRRKRLFIAMDAAFGMEYLHSKNIVHFDLKCENLLVNMRDAHRPICKVGDFGLSKVKHHTLVSGGVRGTLPWMAPELLSGNNSMVSEKIDVFSFGIVMWELLTGEEPYANMHFGAIIGGIVNGSLRPTIPTWCDPGWRGLMEKCWSGNPTERPSFAEVARELRAIAASMNLK
ncbi:hypothetical protein KP509_05G029000 [Ceratopteris richardii]|uniref:Protein kinase domain-containing protein n=1 Tax=Ceratopteris richardii TaxID=49495 RepID=A0A8T2URX0_CERRI|nr:hypothetical protein KP509_05G029000 [Ceratopteris richardii]